MFNIILSDAKERKNILLMRFKGTSTKRIK